MTENNKDLPSSYQQQASSSSNNSNSSRQVQPPTIRHYDDENIHENLFRGDPTLQPNNGLTNSYDYAIFGLAVHELIGKIRAVNVIASLALVILIILSLIFRLLRFELVKLVLSIVVGGMAAILLTVEFASAIRIVGLTRLVQDRVRVLVHPLWRAIFILVIAILCYVIGGLFMYVFCVIFGVSGTLLIAAWVSYSELRREFSNSGSGGEFGSDNSRSNDLTPSEASVAAWSYYSSTVGDFFKESSEQASLLAGGGSFNSQR